MPLIKPNHLPSGSRRWFSSAHNDRDVTLSRKGFGDGVAMNARAVAANMAAVAAG